MAEGLFDDSDTSSDEEYRRIKRKRKRLTQAPSPPPTIPTTWSCPRCTYVNKDADGRCEMCEVKRPSARAATKARAKSPATYSAKSEAPKAVSRAPRPLKPPSSHGSSSVKTKSDVKGGRAPQWSCSTCTLINAGMTLKCVVCGALRARPSTPRRPSETIDSNSDDESPRSVEPLPQAPSKQLWNDKHCPTSMEDLCVHPKKIQEVVSWLRHNAGSSNSKRQRLLFLCGPPGVGKSTIVRSAAAALGLDIKQWKDTSGVGPLCTVTRAASLIEDFGAFLERSQRYASLAFAGTAPPQQHVVLVEEWPALHEQHRSEVQRLLQRRLAARDHQYPIIVVFSDVHEKKVTPASLGAVFSAEVVGSPLVHAIHCNPVAAGMMKKYLGRLAARERVALTPTQLGAIVEASHGDLRHAVNTLQFQRRGVDAGRARDSFQSDFHLIGRVLHPKEHHDNDVLRECTLDGAHLLATVHHNCIDCFTEIDDVATALETFSATDTLLQSVYKDRSNASYYHLAQLVAKATIERSVRVANANPAPHAFRPIGRPHAYAVDAAAQHIRATAQMAFALQHTGAALHRDIVPYQQYLGHGRASATSTVATALETDDEIVDSDMDST
ncbi:hypothetical protein ACHHYP_16824 [Achlya hypogyna]|uniref:RanBP2-type domain-containing protein n=1 Tax=Achlya hypogyna TaxID=1202772 RepID=A0A1V9Y5R3_ACHHY|nr:hypothetical protein ACHHYP_16824 [Achlya hypogyna]